MKIFLARIGFLFVLLLLVTNCATKKSTISRQPFTKPVVSIDTTIYIPHLKSDRKNFFKDSDAETYWVDSIYDKLSLEEKVGQLFMVAAYSNKDTTHVNSIDKLITDNKVGGLIFFQGGPVRQAILTNRYQAKAKVPLFIGIDAEWGLSMRLDSTYQYPWNMTLGAIQYLKLVEKVGENMGKESKRIGAHFDFAPVLDINTNPKNPIIGSRSFGENKVNVADRAIALMTGIQNQGVFSTGKHFPGHGDTSADSHTTLPLVTLSRKHLDLVELYPYKRMFDEGLVSVMVGHLEVPSLEPKPNYPTSISYNVVTNLLQNKMGFDGLIFTDALNMKGVSNFREIDSIPSKPGDIELKAFLAGNDILLFPEDVPASIEKISQAYQDKIITEERLSRSVKKILHYKFKAGLNKYKPIETKNLVQDLNPSSNEALQYQLFENAVTVLKNKDKILPIKNLENNKIAYVKLGDGENSSFVSTLKKYTEVTEVSSKNIDSLNVKLKKFDTVIVGFHKSDKAWADQDFTFAELFWLQEIAKNNKVILDVMAKPYSLLHIANFDDIAGLVVSYQNSEIAQIVSAELIFGAIGAKGKLPVSINPNFKINDGLSTEKLNRLGFTSPENVGMNPLILSKIDDFAKKAIDGKMTPGIQVLVARKGKVIYQKSYGYHTYDNVIKVSNSDLYDIASVTKILATLPNVMQLYDQKKINLETTLGTMLPDFNDSNKKDIHFKELLSHYAGLVAGIPFYKATLDKSNTLSEKYYRKSPNDQFSKQVGDSLFIRNDFNDSIMKMIINSKLLLKKEYKYSDLTFMILKDYLEKTTGKTLDVLIQDNFYHSIGMNNSSFNPLKKFDKNRIPPTEIDSYLRHQILQGYVNDLSAALLGGVSGHAGIFSNAMDVAKMMQLYLQKGNYGNHQYFSEKTFDDFNTCYFCLEGNRRGIGFDKPQQSGKVGPTCGCASLTSFGHTGFTGTMAWADPETEIVYVFLSNRTFPNDTENTLSKENIREDIQEVIYDAIEK
ncbi:MULTISPECIES: glycoside hydrolase family 3 N-terminal domain-containing protein [unclassified Flavobacterium]|jgi:beta-glucosidase-like glycosyl hydrolase/CubicO group peptidase (beta-lactamase class C family)|uniref:glycoside hydrolase family 3 N-terminal domain-containing protein n=1 Tax=unclassified Flavobacterium TaxID=196869 RepID=UPI0025BDB5B4|nr:MULTISPECIES: glycoside hydrolase family 3 N-terminal domain-containing protein [unclassified Flavobacterium]